MARSPSNQKRQKKIIDDYLGSTKSRQVHQKLFASNGGIKEGYVQG